MILSKQEIAEKIGRGALLLDVRSQEECRDDRYPGAINIPLEELIRRRQELEPKSRLILTYCASGQRGLMAAEMLRSYGWDNIYCAGALFDLPPIWF